MLVLLLALGPHDPEPGTHSKCYVNVCSRDERTKGLDGGDLMWEDRKEKERSRRELGDET